MHLDGDLQAQARDRRRHGGDLEDGKSQKLAQVRKHLPGPGDAQDGRKSDHLHAPKAGGQGGGQGLPDGRGLHGQGHGLGIGGGQAAGEGQAGVS